jgi:hypothetical protein
MRRNIPKLPDIPECERTSTVVRLLEIIRLLQEEVQTLRDEIARLKGHKPKPPIKPSALEKNSKDDQNTEKRPGSAKRRKTRHLKIHETVRVTPPNLPEGSRFKGYQPFTVQDLVIETRNTRYLLERWQTPDGTFVVGELPDNVIDGHFGPQLVSFILYQYYHTHATQPLLLELLREFGVDISSGQLNRIITEGKDHFHAEKEEILRVGLEVSGHVHVDDTGARHQGKNGYCTHLGNQLFAWFETTSSKSRVNFLGLLRADRGDYCLSEMALEYMRSQKLPRAPLEALSGGLGDRFDDEEQWHAHLSAVGIFKDRHVRIATEGALLGSVVSQGLKPGLVVISDDAGQFNVLQHALCWIHAERTIAKLVGFTEADRAALEAVRTQIWAFYQELKDYKKAPTGRKKADLATRFDELFTQQTCYASLNLALKRLHANKSELLLVLERPDIPLHNNESERDIREYVKRRKISGSTRSDLGRRCRDTFASLKKTSRKLGVSFWSYLQDRVTGLHSIPPLSELIRERAEAE